MSNSTGPDPVSPPPPGWIPNFDHPTDAGRTMNIAGTVACVSIVTVFFAIRCYSKTRAPKIYADDWTCLIAYISLMLYAITIFLMTSYGEGYHAWEVRQHDYSEILKWLYASSIIYCPMAYMTKVTLLLMTARVFAIKESVARGIYIFIGSLGIAYLPIQFIKTFICIPVHAYWDFNVSGAKCLPQRKVFISDLCLAILTDFIVLILPIPLTYSLRMPIKKKVKIVALLGIGGAAVAVVIYRMYLVILFEKSTDVTSDFVILDLTSTIEASIGLICSCLPSVNILIEKYRSRRERSRSSNQPANQWFVERARRYRNKLFTTTGPTMTTFAGGDSDTENGSYRSHRAKESAGESSNKTLRDSTLRTNATPTRTSIEMDVDQAMKSGQAIKMPMRGPKVAMNISAGRSWPGLPAILCPQVSYGAEGGPSGALSSSMTTCEGGAKVENGNGEGRSTFLAHDLESGVIRRTVEVSVELSKLDSKQEWEGIWDGTTKRW